jgi:MoxR-like ATPase
MATLPITREGEQADRASVFASPAVLQQALAAGGYVTDSKTAHAAFYAANLNLPILLEGPAGAGKTELAMAIRRITGMNLIRLQCYEGITDKQAIGDFNRAMQDLYVLLNRESGKPWDVIAQELTSNKFFMAGPLLEAIESPKRCILLIDEIDKIPNAFEAMLLELLSVWQLSVPGRGTVDATTIPLTILTSNAVRILGDPLRRRCVYIVVEPPTGEMEAAIVARKSPHLNRRTHQFIAGFARALRGWHMEKPPSISEMNNLAQAMDLMGWRTITPEMSELVYPLLIKKQEDLDRIRSKSMFATLLETAAEEMQMIIAREESVQADSDSTEPAPRPHREPGDAGADYAK